MKVINVLSLRMGRLPAPVAITCVFTLMLLSLFTYPTVAFELSMPRGRGYSIRSPLIRPRIKVIDCYDGQRGDSSASPTNPQTIKQITPVCLTQPTGVLKPNNSTHVSLGC